MNQIIFKDGIGLVRGGFLLADGSVVCGCCGEIDYKDNVEIIEVFDQWVDLSDKIIGNYFE